MPQMLWQPIKYWMSSKSSLIKILKVDCLKNIATTLDLMIQIIIFLKFARKMALISKGMKFPPKMVIF